MRESGTTSVSSMRLLSGLALIALSTLAWASIASAQSADDQYEQPTAPSGPAAESQCTVPNDTNGVVDAGDEIICAGNFDVSSGSSAVLQDGDGTQGTFVDGQNANITEGSLRISVTGAPINVSGGNGVLNTEGLFVVATTGVAAATGAGGAAADAAAGAGAGAEGSQPAGVLADVLPETGGVTLIGALAAVALVCTGVFLMLRRRFSGAQ